MCFTLLSADSVFYVVTLILLLLGVAVFTVSFLSLLYFVSFEAKMSMLFLRRLSHMTLMKRVTNASNGIANSVSVILLFLFILFLSFTTLPLCGTVEFVTFYYIFSFATFMLIARAWILS